MIALILAIIVGLVFTYFAMQNTQPVTLQLQNYVLNVPLYFVAIASIVLGITLAFVINLSDAISSSFTMFSKDRKIRSTENAVTHLESRIHELEVENAKLKGTRGDQIFKQSTFAKPNLIQKIRHNLSV